MTYRAELDWARLRSTRVRVPEQVIFRDLVNETVLLNMADGRYHRVDRIGGRFFDVLRSGETLEQAAATLAREYDQPVSVVQRDLLEFCLQLIELGLVKSDAAEV